jgi:site-specific recombinase XerD
MRRVGGTLGLVQEPLGHRDISSTTIYTQVGGRAVSHAVQRLPWALS